MKYLCISLWSYLPFLLHMCFAVTTIPSPPTLVQQPPQEQLFQVPQTQDEADKSVVLNCEALGNPEPAYRWTKNGEPFDYEAEEGHISRQSQKGTLYINSPLDSDEGVYQCFAENIHGTSVSNKVVLRKSEFISSTDQKIKQVSVTKGEPLSLDCDPPSGYPKPKIFWSIQSNTGGWQSINSSRISVDPDGVLHFASVAESNSLKEATYVCSAYSEFRDQYKIISKAVLKLEASGSPGQNVYSPIKQYASPPNITALRGKKLVLSCIYGGTPVPTTVWTKKDSNLQSNHIIYTNYGKTLIIPSVDFQDEGTYECTASNGVGTPQSQTMAVSVQAAPYYWINAPNNTNRYEDEVVSFACIAGGKPTPEVTWYMNGVPLKDAAPNPRRRLDKSVNVLFIDGLKKTDTAVFQCNASNAFGYIFRDFYLNVLDTLTPPKILRVQCAGLTALVVWRPTGGHITSYTIQYSTSFSPDKWEDSFVNIPAPDTRFKVSMTPWANYTFRVIARNAFGSSEPSEHSDACETPEDVPYKNPDNVVGKGTEKDNLVISFTAMPMIEQHAPGFFYKIFWKREDISEASWETAEILEWEKNSIMIPNQSTFKPYRIKVEAHNSKGQAHTAATEVIGFSGEDVPLEEPKNFKCLYVKNSRSAMFSWDPVAPETVRGHFRGYKIQTWTVYEGEGGLREQVVKANVTQPLVTIFRPFSRNLVRVLAFNDMYNGPASQVLEFTTPEGTPGPVAYFDAIPVGSSALHLTWKRPLEPNGLLTGYNIYYREVIGTELGAEKARTPQITDPRDTSAKLAGLKRKTKYRIDICATTIKGQGEKMYIEVQTNDQAEQQPDEPHFVWSHLPDVDGKAGVRVTCVPAVEGHPGSHFFVQFRKKGESTWESSPPEENQDSILVQGLELGSLYEMKVVVVDGPFQTSSKVEEFETIGMDTPYPPKILGVQCDGLTALVIWQPTEDRRAPIRSYTIQHNTSFTPDKWEDSFVNIPAPDTRFKVSMTPWANYTFRVIARNALGPSEPSEHSDACETPEDVPYKNPDNVVGKGTEKDNLVISFTAMPMIEQHAPGFFYKIFWKREDIPGASWQIAKIPEWKNNSIMIPNQSTFKPYRIKVEAHNSKGQAYTAATEVIGYSGEGVPLEAPKNFKLVSVEDARSATFIWDPVSPDSVRGHFRGYKIQTWTVDEGEERLREQVVKANVTQSLVKLFRPYSRNVVRVLAFNDMYNGPSSDVLDFTTPAGTPGPVAYFDAMPLGSSALYLIWKRPLEPNGALTGYDIYYHEVIGTELGAEKARTPQITDPRETRAKLAGLKPKTKYRIDIYAKTWSGKGEKKYIEVQTNAEQQPDEPNFVWVHLPDVDDKAVVRVIWVPTVGGHPGSHFFVQYRKKGETAWESSPPEENQDSILVQGLDLDSLYEMKVVAVDGPFQTSSKVEEFETGGTSTEL